MDTDKTGNMVSTWKKRHYVVQMADGSFKKAMLKDFDLARQDAK
jgi:hypothetical protein